MLILPTKSFVKRHQTSSISFTRIVDTTFLDKIPVVKILDRSYESQDSLFCWYSRNVKFLMTESFFALRDQYFLKAFSAAKFPFWKLRDSESSCNLRATNSTPVALISATEMGTVLMV